MKLMSMALKRANKVLIPLSLLKTFTSGRAQATQSLSSLSIPYSYASVWDWSSVSCIWNSWNSSFLLICLAFTYSPLSVSSAICQPQLKETTSSS